MPISEFLAGLRSQVGNALLILPSVTACVFNGQGRLLVARHMELDGVWSVPGGIVEPDESPAEAVVREVREEVGLRIRIRGLIGAYGGPEFRSTYRNGDKVSYVMTVYGCTVDGGEITPDGVEIAEALWFTEAETTRLRLPTWGPVVVPDGFAWWRASPLASNG